MAIAKTLRTRREIIKLGTMGALSLIVGKVLAKNHEPIVMKMFVDFGCPHCQNTFDAISPLLQNEKHVDFQLKPVLPVKIKGDTLLPSPAVRFYYACERFVDRANAIRVASALFLGFKTKADLSSFDSVYQWVMLQGIKLDYKKIKDYYNKFGPRSAFIDALSEFKYYQVVYVPYIVVEKLNGARVAEWRWNNNSKTYIDSVVNFLKEN